jgi:hypothetical protein
MKPYKNVEWLRQKYEAENLTTRAIADMVGVAQMTIYGWLKKLGIKPRRRGSIDERGPKNPAWKGGRKNHCGYIVCLRPEHPNANKRGYVGEHQLILEQKLGRYLRPNEVVHHINGDKGDNHLENLKLMFDRDHRSMHSRAMHLAQAFVDEAIK